MKLNDIFNMAAAAAFAVAAAACSQEPAPVEKPEPAPEPIIDPVELTVFTAGLPDSETKTYLGENQDGKFPILWSEGDCIAVDGTASEALAKEDAGSKEATFMLEGVHQPPYTAIYPATAVVSADKVKFASVQATSEGCYDPAAALMAAYSETETSLSFNHLCAYLKINVNYPSNCTRRATKATFSGNGGEILAGEAELSVSDGIPSTSALTAGEKSVTVNLSAEAATADGTGAAQSFLIALPPTTFENGFRIDFSDAKGTFLKAETSSNVPLTKGVVLNAPELNFSYVEGGNSDLEEVEPGQLTIVWDKAVAIETVSSSYGRVHRLNDGRLMVSYTSKNTVKVRFSSDNGKTWSAATQICGATTGAVGELRYYRVTPDFAQLSSANPYKPGRIICAVNERGFMDVNNGTVRNDMYPYFISVSASDDYGKTWNELKKIYTSSTNFERGCYEPFVLELPDGTVQIYFADKSPYQENWQNISVIESKDGGETWSTNPRLVCYTEGLRDGMASATIYDGNIYVGIEHLESESLQFYPQIVYNPVSENWKSTVFGNSTYRFDPFETKMASATQYSGAPYISQTDNYMIMSYQTVDVTVWDEKDHIKAPMAHRIAEVQVCPKSEFNGGKFSTMRVKTRGPVADGVNTGINWPSLCPLGGDDFLLVYELHGLNGNDPKDPNLCCVRGHITTSTPEFK